MGERRRSSRQKSFLRGCIYFNDRRSAVDCLIRDLSAAGARLIFSAAVNVPDKIDLYIPQKEETLCAHVQWRHGDEAGIAFVRGGQLGAAPPPPDQQLAERVARLEIEIASLRRMLRRLKREVADGIDQAA
jgi:hypothetical protein